MERDIGKQRSDTSHGQHPLAIVRSCIDSRSSVEIIFDLGLGDVFTIRIAGNVARNKFLGSIEYGCKVAGAKLILVMGHTRCGAVTTAVDLEFSGRAVNEATGCDRLDLIVHDIQKSIGPSEKLAFANASVDRRRAFVDQVARKNVIRSVQLIEQESATISR